MSDCVIKLFGKRIPLEPLEEEEREEEKACTTPNCISSKPKNEDKVVQKDFKGSTDPSTPIQPQPEFDSRKKEGEDEKSNNTSNNTSSENSKEGDDKALPKRPDKILPCPRCHSMDTKFCYYNNYNVNQPRHFCKNCQRYWTAGGSMRNVPVGAGRRKSKSNPASLSGSHFYRSLPVPSSLLQPLQSNSVCSKVNGTGTVLSFGSDTNMPLNGFHIMETGDENSSISSVEGLKCKDEEKKKGNTDTCTGTNDNTSWPCAWGPVPAMYNGSGFGVQIYPYWGCIPWTNGAWSIPWNAGACAGSPTLGKHSRDGNILSSEAGRDGTKNGNIWVPKTLRIDNPEEAAKSSIWAMVGAKNEKSAKIGDKIVRMFDSKGDVKNSSNMLKKSQMLFANPAALARSVNFQESA